MTSKPSEWHVEMHGSYAALHNRTTRAEIHCTGLSYRQVERIAAGLNGAGDEHAIPWTRAMLTEVRLLELEKKKLEDRVAQLEDADTLDPFDGLRFVLARS